MSGGIKLEQMSELLHVAQAVKQLDLSYLSSVTGRVLLQLATVSLQHVEQLNLMNCSKLAAETDLLQALGQMPKLVNLNLRRCSCSRNSEFRQSLEVMSAQLKIVV